MKSFCMLDLKGVKVQKSSGEKKEELRKQEVKAGITLQITEARKQ
ncbi:hypothetical protein [Chitinophaga sp.]|nr:hypothetical protein [Chitinophaga sp.]